MEVLVEIFSQLIAAKLWIIAIFILIIFFFGKINIVILNESKRKPESFNRVIRQLKEDHWGEIYISWLRSALKKLSYSIGDSYKFKDKYRFDTTTKELKKINTSKKSLGNVFSVNPFTYESYWFCFLLSYFYPIVVFVALWILGSDGKLGELQVFENGLSFWSRFIFVFGLLSIVGTLWFYNKAYLAEKKYQLKNYIYGLSLSIVFSLSFSLHIGEFKISVFSGLLLFLIILLIIYLSSLRTQANSKTDLLSTILIVSLSFISLSLLYLTVAKGLIYVVSSAPGIYTLSALVFLFLSAITIKIILFLINNVLIRNKKHRNLTFAVIFTAFILLSSFISIHYGNYSETIHLTILFYLILPVVNTSIDWLSLSISRGLLHSIEKSDHSIVKIITWAFADFFIALILMIAISTFLTFIVSIANNLSGHVIVDLDLIYFNIRSDPMNINNYWIYFLLFSTLIPTVIHFTLAGGAIARSIPRNWRHSIADNLESDQLMVYAAWAYLTLIPTLGFFIMPMLLYLMIYFIISNHGIYLGSLLINLSEFISSSIY